MPPTYKKPLGRSILIGCFAFVALLGLVLSVVNYSTYKRGLYARYEAHIADILNFTKSQIDVDDLAECVKTKQKSKKYLELQEFMDSFKDHADIHYLYVIKPLHAGPVDNVMNIIAAMSAYEKENMPEMEVQLCGLTGEEYAPDYVQKYLDAAGADGISYFSGDWVKGVTYMDYTGAVPLFTSAGDCLGLLCVDVNIIEIRKVVMDATLFNIALIFLLGAAFMALFILWANYNIANPIKKLETSVTAFAYQNKGKEDVDSIVIKDPRIHTDNEVESLANAVVKMSKDMKTYVENVIEAESKAKMLGELASKDALTNVRNKTSYDHYAKDVNKQIAEGRAEFAVVMIDLNHLKLVNDTYGHERGNEYIKKSCDVVCHTFAHSPVFRIGGDEFVAILRGDDFKNRKALVASAEEIFKAASADMSQDPWNRLSAAIGMADFIEGSDKIIDDVFNRADKIMYANKVAMKAVRRA